MDKGSAEEEKIDALLNSSVSGCGLPSSGLRRSVRHILPRPEWDCCWSSLCGSLDKGLLWACRREVTPETWDDLGCSGDLGWPWL